MHKTPQILVRFPLHEKKTIFYKHIKAASFLYAHKKWSIWKIPGFYNSHSGKVQPMWITDSRV